MQSLGVTLPQVKEQIQNFTDGFPWLKIEAAATVGHGILQLTPQQQAHYVDVWKEFQRQSGVLIEKFQPASGAASRMFKNLFAFINEGKTEPETDFEKHSSAASGCLPSTPCSTPLASSSTSWM